VVNKPASLSAMAQGVQRKNSGIVARCLKERKKNRIRPERVQNVSQREELSGGTGWKGKKAHKVVLWARQKRGDGQGDSKEALIEHRNFRGCGVGEIPSSLSWIDA